MRGRFIKYVSGGVEMVEDNRRFIQNFLRLYVLGGRGDWG